MTRARVACRRGARRPELLTIRAVDRLRAADLVLYDALVDRAALRHAPQARWAYVGKRAGRHSIEQETIERVMIRRALRGERIVRLKSGDPVVFGRGGEEALALAAAGVPCENRARRFGGGRGARAERHPGSRTAGSPPHSSSSRATPRTPTDRCCGRWRRVRDLVILMGTAHERPRPRMLLARGWRSRCRLPAAALLCRLAAVLPSLGSARGAAPRPSARRSRPQHRSVGVLGVARDDDECGGEAAVRDRDAASSGAATAAETPGTISQGTPAAASASASRHRARTRPDRRSSAARSLAAERAADHDALDRLLLDRVTSGALAHVGPARLWSMPERGAIDQGVVEHEVRGARRSTARMVSSSGSPGPAPTSDTSRSCGLR